MHSLQAIGAKIVVDRLRAATVKSDLKDFDRHFLNEFPEKAAAIAHIPLGMSSTSICNRRISGKIGTLRIMVREFSVINP